MFGEGLIVLKVCMVGKKSAKEMLRENYVSFVMKRG